VLIQVSAADLDVSVRPTGVAEDGTMELPDTVRRAGWYRYSALPGSRVGSTVIAAHVDTRAEGLGPFAALAELRKGDRIVVSDRSGTEHGYRVRVIRQVTQSRLPVDELFDRGGAPRLVLITCGGAYDARNGYHDNIVVLAEPDS
jgi:LPXTG-site transpeptidase (sortase) family protein